MDGSAPIDKERAEPSSRESAESSPQSEQTDKPLKIAILSYRSHAYTGGQGVYMNHISRALVNRGHKVDIISGPPYPFHDERVKLIKLPSLDLYAQPHNGHFALRPRHLKSFTDTYEYFAHLAGRFPEPYTFGRRAYKYLKERLNDYDVIFDNQTLAKALIKIDEELGIPLVSIIHHPITRDRRTALEAETSFRKRILIRQWYSFLDLQIKVARKMRYIITASENSKRDAIEDFKLEADTLFPIHLGVDDRVFKERPDVERRPNRIVTAASADVPLKGLRYLIAAFAELRKDQPDLELVVIGKPRKGPTSKLLDKLKLRDVVQFKHDLTGDEVAAEYAAAAVAVTPSLYEGFGFPAAEAMACGTPIIVTTGGSLPEVAGDVGMVVKKGNSEALAKALQALLADPDKQADMSKRGLERAKNHFNWVRVAKDYEAIFDRAIAEKQKGKSA